MDFGGFSKVTFVDGTSPAINAANLNGVESSVSDLDEESRRSQFDSLKHYMKYGMYRSYKEITSFTNILNWSSGGCSIGKDTVNSISGHYGIKLLETSSSAGWNYIYSSISTKDCSKFNNGVDSTSTADAVVAFAFYVSDKTKVDYIQYRMGNSDVQCYHITYDSSSIENGWNVLTPNLSDFSTNGTPAWNNIDWLKFAWKSTVNGDGEYVTIDFAGIYRSDWYYSYIPNVWQIQNNGSWTYDVFDPYSTLLQMFDSVLGKTGFYLGASTTSSLGLKIGDSMSSFMCKQEHYCKIEGQISATRWYADSSNYVVFYISSSTMYIKVYESGSLVDTQSQALDQTLHKNTKVKILIEKSDAQVRFVASFDDQLSRHLETTTTISTSGHVFAGGGVNISNLSFITDIIISNRKTDELLSEKQYPTLIIKTVDESVNNSSAYQDDDELFCYLQPYSLLEVEIVLFVDGVNATADFKVKWDLTGDIRVLANRGCFGAGTSATDLSNSNAIACGMKTYNQDGQYGSVSVGSNVVNEKMVFRTEKSGGKLQLQWAQINAEATNLYLLEGSYMKITKLQR